MENRKVRVRLYQTDEELGHDFYRLAEEAFAYGSPWTEEQYEQTVARSDLTFFIAEIEDRPVGYVGGKIILDEAEVYSIAVEPASQNQKVASQLIEAYKTHCRANGVKILFLEVRESNLTARTFYAAHQFKEISMRKGYYNEPEEDAIIMLCEIRKKEKDDK
ncbi:ribosomal protein S18-alanine N-acetyltransferase [Alkalibacterium pelagium]|uniref:Ribosomal-protein-alanine N-acetyltransferase n=1 Tax=Alkalibacterium pelagium TaxID=426702 RepID=A0A1H7EUK3_9LACT|nr:ribosomal protein S18-alanine N-acetyltransferase [Alkalibacterium pelagium]GEN49648.1 ribosomal-protein-alanine acetyltransferase [Alkalibacterium pelagium]SEK17583.1 ribosomal-protein-alanine N-acetyltransferase [Alkalibacterium pelagium]